MDVAHRVANLLGSGFTDAWSGVLTYEFVETSYERAWQHFRCVPTSARVSLRTATELRMRFQPAGSGAAMRFNTAIITPDLDCAEGVIVWRAD